MPIDASLREKLNRAHPDALGPYDGENPGKATFFWSVRNQTLYTDTAHKSVHNGVMQDHPEVVREILPSDIYERMMAGEFKHPRLGNNQIWQVVSVYALMGRLGSAAGYNIVSVWPRSRSGVHYAGGELGATSFFEPEDEIPRMLDAMMGRGRVVNFGGEPPRVDETWVVTMMDEIEPSFVGDIQEDPGGRTTGTMT